MEAQQPRERNYRGPALKTKCSGNEQAFMRKSFKTREIAKKKPKA